MVEQPKPALVERLRIEGIRNGGQGAYAWQARELCGKAADALEAFAEREAAKDAEIARLNAGWQKANADALETATDLRAQVAELVELVWLYTDPCEVRPEHDDAVAKAHAKHRSAS